MLSARGWGRLMTVVTAAMVLSVAACEEEDAVFGPLDDTTAPAVTITGVSQSGDTLKISAQAEDFIGVVQMIIEVRLPSQPVTEVTPEGDTITLGALLTADTSRFAGRNTEVSADLSLFPIPFTQATELQIRVRAIDQALNEGVAARNVIVLGSEGGGLAGPQVQITSPTDGQTVRDNTLIRVGVSASDPSGLARLNVTLSGALSASDNTQFTEFRTDVDTLLDFFIPDGTSGTLTISAEVINRDGLSNFAQIAVTVADQVPGDTLPPTVSMVASGGTLVRADEPRRMEVDDSLVLDLVAEDLETAISRVGVTVLMRNIRSGGAVTVTIFDDSVFGTPISGTVPIRFGVVPEDPRFASVFTEDDVPDTLQIELTAWAFDDAATPNCGATVDTVGVPNSLECTSSDPIQAVGIPGGLVQRLVVAGRTIGFPQGSLIADAAVDTLRELLFLSDINFGVVRVFDLRNETFVDNVPVGSEPWGLSVDLSEDTLFVANSGGTNISVVALGPETPGSPAVEGEVDRFQTQDIQVFRVEEDFDAFGERIFPVEAFDFSDRPQFAAQADNGFIMFSTRPAQLDQQPGTIREFDPELEEIRFFISYADRQTPSNPQIQIVNADSVFAVAGGREFKICDHPRGDPTMASCTFVRDSLEEADDSVAAQPGWDVEILSDLVISSIGLQDTTFVAPSGDRKFIAFGEGDTPARPGRIIIYSSDTETITNSLMVTDLTGNAAQQVFGLALNNDGTLGVGRGEVAFYFDDVLRLLGINSNINPTGSGAVLHPDHNAASFNDPDTRLSFLGSGDAAIEIVDTRFFSFKRGEVLIRDPVVGPLRVTRRLPTDPANVAVKLYGVTPNGVVVIQVRDNDIAPI